MLLTNYLTSGWRNLFKNKLFSAINIFGLAIGITAVCLISLFVRSELSYDKFWQDSDRIARAHVTFSVPGRDPIASVATPGPFVHALKKDFEQVEYAARLGLVSPLITHQEQSFIEQISMADADILNIFNFDFIHGNAESALSNPHSLILNETLSEKYFGDQNPVGQTLTMDFGEFKRDFKITAVIADLPDNTQLEVTGLMLIDEADWQDQPWRLEAWFSVNTQTYFKTYQSDDLAFINSQLDDFTERNFPTLPIGDESAKKTDFIALSAMPLTELHLNASGMGEYRPTGSKTTVYTFSTIAMLILIVAAINFMNLSTARASQRAKEVSLRKVMGASRSNLVVQFLGESVLITLISLVIAVVFIELALPVYNEMLGKTLAVDYLSTDLLALLILSLSVGVLGGLYPAFVLSNFRPATVLKANKSAESGASMSLRYALVVLQFAVSIGLFISTSVVYSQMKYADSMDAGFTKDNLLVVHRLGRDAANEKREMLVKEITKMPGVVDVTWSNETPASGNENNTMVRTEGMAAKDSMLIGQRGVGYNFFKTYQIQLIAGRTYQRDRNDTALTADELREGNNRKSSIIVNESAVRRLGFASPQEALGQSIFMGRGNPEEELEAEMEIIGVVGDVHFESLKSSIRPEIYNLNTEWGAALTIRYQGDADAVVKQVESLWESEVATVPFSYAFVADDVAEQYLAEQGQASMFAGFSGLAILIACLGLYGLASFTAERRTKEIGIRKVMGASVSNIISLLVWQFSKPVILANLIAWPVSFYLMNNWLQSFVYRVDSSLILILSLAAAIGALLIAWVTVAGNSFSVARSNPILALRYE
ncbi:ABC transporter permease [Thalassotalea sp. LPB0316]|uniref:ABC transporter permease n=1 Tax=Thalassotalea sp. LPB0316 TaxID=2769490 RepID=UPI001868F20A|nr:ABC transporter permease [Thalassotalea sp. LPB0316]QOL26226.1 ABC transporter permease [Thalassotalea sp. LPB0316]